MSADRIAPSDIVLTEVSPLGATFGRSEREIAAALIVRVCQLKGGWISVCLLEMAQIAESDPWMRAVLSNPFQNPHFHDLVAHGFAIWLDDCCLMLTEAAIERLARSRWVRRAEPETGGYAS